jgi:hypothetical protein
VAVGYAFAAPAHRIISPEFQPRHGSRVSACATTPSFNDPTPNRDTPYAAPQYHDVCSATLLTLFKHSETHQVYLIGNTPSEGLLMSDQGTNQTGTSRAKVFATMPYGQVAQSGSEPESLCVGNGSFCMSTTTLATPPSSSVRKRTQMTDMSSD